MGIPPYSDRLIGGTRLQFLFMICYNAAFTFKLTVLQPACSDRRYDTRCYPPSSPSVLSTSNGKMFYILFVLLLQPFEWEDVLHLGCVAVAALRMGRCFTSCCVAVFTAVRARNMSPIFIAARVASNARCCKRRFQCPFFPYFFPLKSPSPPPLM